MELDERKKSILNAIIRNYQETGEPVGSRTISKIDGLQLSPATIRNEMSDLEEMGLIVQPHTSAGRVPTDKAYRLYVDELMQEGKQLPQPAAEETMLLNRVNRLEELLMQMAKILANNTNYATMITGPKASSGKLKFLQLSPMQGGRLLAVIVLNGDMVRNDIFDIGEDLDAQEVLQLNLLLNQNLVGLSIEEINLAIISRIKEKAGTRAELVGRIIDAIGEAISAEETQRVYTSGTPNIFKYPELTGGDKASELISAIEEKQLLQPVFADGDHRDIQVYIGDEVPVDTMKNCSVVTATYELGSGVCGKIGIIGPKRMDYEKVVNTLKETMSQLDDIFLKQE